MKSSALLTVGLVLIVALLPASASARLPGFPSTLVQPARSIAGIALGDDALWAEQRWGAADACSPPPNVYCSYDGGSMGSAFYRAYEGRVEEIGVSVALNDDGEPRIRGPVRRLRTVKDIGVGSRIGEVRRAYPKANPEGGAIYLKGPGGSVTLFLLDGVVVTGMLVYG